jgi:minor extracellular serine protease Vpr
LACSALPNDSLAGAIALIRRGTCDFADKVNHAARAGAVAAVIYQDGDRIYPFNILGLSDTSIPTVMVGAATGAVLQEHLRAHPGAHLTIDPRAPQADAVFDEVADFSSRGPSIDAGAIKPELVAPGYDLYTATQKFDDQGDLYDPSGYTYVGGTSYAAALTAGAAALVMQQRPGFDPAKIKSAVVNTASDIRDETGRPSVIASGAGKLNISAAVKTTVTVEPSTLSFGILEPASLPVSLALRLANSGPAPVSLRLSVLGSRDQSAEVRLSQSTVDLDTGQDATLTVQLAGERPEPGAYEGYVVIEGGEVPLRVPYLYLVSDGAPDTYFYLFGDGYIGSPNEENIKLEFRVTDRYGVPAPDLEVVFRVTRGNGRISYADETTDVVGKAAAIVSLGSAAGEYEFTAEVAGFENIPFSLRVRR